MYCNMLKCLRKILEMQGSAGLYVTTKGATSSESLGLVCNVLAREILESLRNCLPGTFSSNICFSFQKANIYCLIMTYIQNKAFKIIKI